GGGGGGGVGGGGAGGGGGGGGGGARRGAPPPTAATRPPRARVFVEFARSRRYESFGQIALATAMLSGWTATGRPFCHCTMQSSAPTRRPLSSYLTRPSGKNLAGPSLRSILCSIWATLRRSVDAVRSKTSLKIITCAYGKIESCPNHGSLVF